MGDFFTAKKSQAKNTNKSTNVEKPVRALPWVEK